jgi:hypothetical protein
MEEELDDDVFCRQYTVFNLYSEYFTKNDLEGFGDFKGGVQILRRVKCVDDFVLLAKEETLI